MVDFDVKTMQPGHGARPFAVVSPVRSHQNQPNSRGGTAPGTPRVIAHPRMVAALVPWDTGGRDADPQQDRGCGQGRGGVWHRPAGACRCGVEVCEMMPVLAPRRVSRTRIGPSSSGVGGAGCGAREREAWGGLSGDVGCTGPRAGVRVAGCARGAAGARRHGCGRRRAGHTGLDTRRQLLRGAWRLGGGLVSPAREGGNREGPGSEVMRHLVGEVDDGPTTLDTSVTSGV